MQDQKNNRAASLTNAHLMDEVQQLLHGAGVSMAIIVFDREDSEGKKITHTQFHGSERDIVGALEIAKIGILNFSMNLSSDNGGKAEGDKGLLQ